MKMRNHTQFFLYLVALFQLIKAEIDVTKHGVRTVKTGDMAIKFYVTAVHRGSKGDGAIAARLQMHKCCLKVSAGEMDCNAMKLINGFAKIFHPKDTADLEMYFVNSDLSNREGNCTLRLLSKLIRTGGKKDDGGHWNVGRDFMIPFKTEGSAFFSNALSYLGWNSNDDEEGKDGSTKSTDEHRNYKCLIRYNGARSIYNEETGHCDPTPKCSENQMISPTTGKCEKIRDEPQDANYLRSTYPKEMMQVEKPWYDKFVTRPQKQGDPSKYGHSKLAPVCVHGEQSKGPDGKPNCVCKSGWRSLTKEEYMLKGGALEPDGTAPITTLCNIQIHGRGVPWGIFLLLTAIILPIIVLLVWAKYTGVHENSGGLRKNSKDSLEEIEHDDDSDGKADDNKKGCRGSEEDADEIISEIAGRREQRPKRNAECHSGGCLLPSKDALHSDKRDLTSMSPTNSVKSMKETASKLSEISQKQPDKSSNTTSAIDSYTKFNPEPYSFSEHTEMQQLHVPLPSLTKGIVPKSLMTFDENKNVHQSPSTDELLTMKEREKKGAHIPMTPVSTNCSRCSSAITVISEGDYDRNNNNTRRSTPLSFASLSSEEITQRKKQQWDQFIESVSSSEELQPRKKSSHFMLSIPDQTGSFFGEAKDENMNIVNSPENPATASRSLPEMKVKKSFSSSSWAPEATNIPIPPESSIKKSLERMKPEDYEVRQDALNLLQSLSSHHSVRTQRECQEGMGWVGLPSSNPSADSRDTMSSMVGNAPPSGTHSGDDLRIGSIFGNLGMDEDIDEALKQISSINLTNNDRQPWKQSQTPPQSNNYNPFKQMETGGTRQHIDSDNLHSDLFSMSPIRSKLVTPTGSSENCNGLNLNSLNFTSWIHSTSSPSQDQSGQGAVQGSSTNINIINSSNSSLGLGSSQSQQGRTQETDSAYRIKSSLESALKASKSKSFTNFF